MADVPRRLDAAAVADRLGGLDATLGTLERTPGATAETAMAAVSLLTEVYGEALARVMDRVSGQRRLVEEVMDDELLGHLLILHDIHPETAEQRIVRTLDALRRQGAADAESAGMDGTTVRVRLVGWRLRCREGEGDRPGGRARRGPGHGGGRVHRGVNVGRRLRPGGRARAPARPGGDGTP